MCSYLEIEWELEVETTRNHIEGGVAVSKAYIDVLFSSSIPGDMSETIFGPGRAHVKLSHMFAE